MNLEFYTQPNYQSGIKTEWSLFLNMQDLREFAFHICFPSKLLEYMPQKKMRAYTKTQDNTKQGRSYLGEQRSQVQITMVQLT